MELEPFSVLPQYRPMIMVHRGWKESRRSKSTPGPSLYSSRPRSERPPLSEVQKVQLAPQEFAFVNGTKPFKNKEPSIRRLVRSHVVRDTSRKKRRTEALTNRSQTEGNTSSSIENAEELTDNEDSRTSASINSKVSGSETSLSRYESYLSIFVSPSLDPNPELSPIIYHVRSMGTAMWPLEDEVRFNPISPASWFDWALSDDALFYALLCTTATYAGLILGSNENKDAILHEGRSVGLLKQWLEGLEDGDVNGKAVEEGMIGAVSCLALTEALRGNFEGWKAHMSGARKMAELKGGVRKLSLTLQLKLHRADLTGAVEFMTPPFFASHNRLPQYSSHKIHRQGIAGPSKRLFTFLTTLPLDPDLLNMLMKLWTFSHQISLILSSPTTADVPSQIILTEETYGLRYALLQPSRLDPKKTSSDQTLNNVLRLGALLYMQATLQEFPFATLGSRYPVRALRDSVTGLKIRNRQEGELMVWLLFMGGLEARDGGDRMWFVEQLAKLVRRLSLAWDGVERALAGLWFVERVHGVRCRALWDEILFCRVLDDGFEELVG